jgi:hypothetical protein
VVAQLHQKEISSNSSVALKGSALGMCGQVTTLTVPVKTKKEVCSGCSTYETIDESTDIIIYCFVPHHINGQYCPCSTCILKMMCEDTCLKFDIYIHKKKDGYYLTSEKKQSTT